MTDQRIESFLQRIRERRRDDYQKKRDASSGSSGSLTAGLSDGGDSSSSAGSSGWRQCVKSLRQKSGEVDRYEALCRLRQALDRDPHVSVPNLLAVDGALDFLVGLLTDPSEDPKIQLQTAECLVSISLGPADCCARLCKAVSPYLTILMQAGEPGLQWRMMIATANLCLDLDSSDINILRNQSVFLVMSKLINSQDKALTEAAVSVLLSVVMKQPNDFNRQLVSSDLALVPGLYTTMDSASPTSDLCQMVAVTLFHLTYVEDMPRDMIRSQKLMAKLEEALSTTADNGWPIKVVIPLVRCLSIGFARGTVWPRELALRFVQASCQLLTCQFIPVRNETLWALCNFTFISVLHCQQCLPSTSQLLSSCLETVSLSNSMDVAELASSMMNNLTKSLSECIANEHEYLRLSDAVAKLIERMHT